MYGKISIDDLIMNNSYVLNTFDIIILSDYFKIPITLISAKTFKENNKDILTLNINNKNSYIIRVLKKLLKFMKKNFFCNGTIIKNNNKKIINLSGDPSIKVKDFLVKYNIIDKNNIIIHRF